ncbi:MAG: bifunctional adenosylcobinamide kinase/adenosylcobinamide-phosphate guanylyltransferase [Gammaproteobacteria bacterium]|nr:bifunctional adenosylcobinamide kinase/adenosylcobinamide-phosphate guanylyltransferase [Gammaproteobacteria bacterium]
MQTLILGGIKSGKTGYAESLAWRTGYPVIYIATATAGDAAMSERIARHRVARPAAWTTVEEPLALADCLRAHAQERRCLIVDCLTLWLSNLLCQSDPVRLRREQEALLRILPSLPGDVLYVSSETNLGVIPDNALARQFCDEIGLLHQALAARCEQVIWMVAGLPVSIKR